MSPNLEKIEAKMDRMLEHLGADAVWKSNADKKFDALLAQVQKTNGRVTALETWKSNWQAQAAIFLSVITFAGQILIGWAKDKFLK